MVPEGWRSLPLGDMLERITNGLVYNPRQTEGVRVTRIETISDARIDVSKVGFAEYSPAMEQYRLQRGDILYSHINSLKHIGKVAFFDSEEVLYHGMNLLLLRANNSVLPKYLYYLLDSSVGQRYAHTYAKRAVNQASINIAELRQFHFKVPPLYEQEHIIEILQTWDTSIAQTQALIAATRERKRGLMQVLLTGKKRFKEFGGQAWRDTRLVDAYTFTNGRAFKPSEWTTSGLPIIRIQNLTGTQADFNYFAGEIEERHRVRDGDFLLSWSATVRPFIWRGEDAALNQHIFKVGAAPGSDLMFGYYLIDFEIDKMLSMIHGTSMKHLTKRDLNRIQTELPSIVEQRRIAEVLSTADAEITNLEQQLEAYKLQKRGLMQQLLTGKKRVKVNELEAVA